MLAFWRYGDFIQGRGAPYLDLPATGWDTYSVTGRGYIQGHFRGQMKSWCRIHHAAASGP